jgi:esterase/lipase
MFRKNPKLFSDPGIQYPELQQDFGHYITEWKKIIGQYRQDLLVQPEKIIEANAPYELLPAENPKKIGALLVHGLLDSSFILKDIGTHLQTQGLQVRSLLLPGHGVVPGALLHVQYQQWLETVQAGIDSFPADIEKIILVGFSMGGASVIHQATQKNSRIAGIIALAPALKIKSMFRFTFKWLQKLSRLSGRAAWIHIVEENDYAKYRSVPFNAAFQVQLLSEEIKNQQQPSCPLLFILSHDDKIVSPTEPVKYFEAHSHPKNQLIYYTNRSKKFKDPRIIVRHSSFPEKNIQSFSHIALPTAPSNLHYGIHSDYIECQHNDSEHEYTLSALNRVEAQIYNKLYEWNVIDVMRKRLTFNPDFDFMVEKINEFIRVC